MSAPAGSEAPDADPEAAVHGPSYVDTHCHLDRHGELTVDEQVAKAREAGVARLVMVGTSMASSTRAVQIASWHPEVHAVVGIHPNDAVEATEDVLEAIDTMAGHERVVGVGETGLDYHWDETTPEQQEAAFRAQIEIAERHGRTLVIHCREAWDDCLRILGDAGPPERVVMHCFSGDEQVVARCAEAGYFVSFAGNITFTNAPGLRRAAAAVPPQLLLTETDSPYLTPHPHRGEPNDSSFVPLVVDQLAETLGRDRREMAATVWRNACRAFGLPEEPAAGEGG